MAHEIQFARGTFYKSNGGMAHLKHTLRDRYDPERIPNPNIQVRMFTEGKLQDVEKTKLYDLYQYNVEHKQRKNANLYFEYMVSDYDPHKTQEIAQYLSKKLDNRPVFAIEHHDEAHYHTHFIIFEKDLEHPRSMNLNKGDLRQLRWDIGKITQQVVKSAGSGLQEHVGPRGDIAFEKQLVQQQREKAQSIQEIQEQVKQILDIYKTVEIYTLNYDKGKFQIYNHGIQQFSRVDDIPWEKLQNLQVRGNENILFAPAKGEPIKAVFIDDIPIEKIQELPMGSVVVQTSKNKFQAHIPLTAPKEPEEATAIQKTLAGIYGGDVASTDIYHLRRLPGFRNWKYVEPFYAGIAYIQEKGQTLDAVLANVKQTQKQFDGWKKQINDYWKSNDPKVQKETIEIVNTLSGKWDTLFEQKQDPSAADFSWCLACLQRGYSPQAVAAALLEVSQNLEIRKQGHIQDYVERTVAKAQQLAKELFREEVQFQNQENRIQQR